MNRNISIAVLLVILLSFFLSRNMYTETFIDDLDIIDADNYKEDVVNDVEPEQIDVKDMNDSMLAIQDFTTFAIKGDRGEAGEKGDKGPVGINGIEGPKGPQGESLSGSIRSTGKLWLGSDGNGASGSDNNHETQLYLGGSHNQGANNGRIGHTTYKLKIDGYDNSGSTVYPIMVRDKNKNVDFYIKNRDSPSSKPLAVVNGDLKLISSDSMFETPNIKSNDLNTKNITSNDLNTKNITSNDLNTKNITLNGQNLSHHLMPKGSIIAFSTNTNLPHGWNVCDGTNGTPDLRGRFILGSSANKAIGAKGGEERVRLNVNEMPSHSHRISQLNRLGNPDGWKDGGRHYWRNNDYRWNRTPDQGKMVDASGGNQSHNNMPPYYALVYIMKLI
jgi:hypothetical protein